MSETEWSPRLVNPETLPNAPGYSQVVEARGGRTVYISGQVALDAEGRLIGGEDFEAQARQVFANLGRALDAVGLGFPHLVKITIFLTDVAHLATLRRVRDEVVNPASPPASTLVQVAALARPEWLCEIDAVAVGPD